MNAQIGRIIKRHRKDLGYTLQDLAAKSSLSTSYLSLTERGLNSPTIENLNSICRALNITLSSLIAAADEESDIVVKAADRKAILASDEYLYEAATEGEHSMSCVVMTVRDGSVHKSNPHVADEVGFIVSGALLLIVSGREYLLYPGDCIYVDANQAHSYRKISDEDCVSFWTYSNPAHAVMDVEIQNASQD